MKFILPIFLFVTVSLSTLAQSIANKIKIEHADSLYYNQKRMGKNVQALFGNVKFTHENIVMFCDSAFMLNDSNRVEAYSKVHLIQGDTLHLYGDQLFYEGNTSIAKVRKNVKMVNKNTTLTTQFLDYNRNTNIGYYYNKGKIVSDTTILTSKSGYYYAHLSEVVFKDSVVVHDTTNTMFSDTLRYHTTSKVASILGPTFIVSKENLIYTEDGFYNTKFDKAKLLKNSYIQTKEQILKGDTIFYDKKSGLGEVFGHMSLNDTVKNVIIEGNYGFYNEITQYAFATKMAQLKQISNKDTLFLHADTLVSLPAIDTIQSKMVKAYHKVKFFRTDLQGICDSMVYDFKDSTNTFYRDPVIWMQGNQITGDKITIFSKDSVVDRILIEGNAFVIAPEDTSRYNQLKGKKMIGFVKNNDLHKIDVFGNGETIYYPKDSEDVLGMNKAECSDMTIYLKERKVDKIVMRVAPVGKIMPTFLSVDDENRLQGFFWLEEYRPKTKEAIFDGVVVPKQKKAATKLDDFETF